jgi:hypothetical protein
MCASKVPGAHQELVHYFAAREPEGFFEQFYPFFFGQGVVCVQPVPERAVGLF